MAPSRFDFVLRFFSFFGFVFGEAGFISSEGAVEGFRSLSPSSIVEGSCRSGHKFEVLINQ